MNALQIGRLTPITRRDGRLRFDGGAPTYRPGFYWIYTSYESEQLSAARPGPPPKSIRINERSLEHDGLGAICQLRVGNFWMVYNGIAGTYRKLGVRERVLQHYRGHASTGSLAIALSSLDDLDRWRASYVLWDEVGPDLGQQDFDKPLAEYIETLWRRHYGWPTLCGA